jgi:regulatory protein
VKITNIEAQVKIRGRYSVFVDEKFAFGISELGLIDSKLRIGQEISKDDLENLKSVAATDKIYNQALSLIMRRPRSRWELEDYLNRKKSEPEIAREVLRKLESKGYIDDLDFARRWVENRRLLRSTSKRKLQLELRQKRVSESIVAQILEEDEADEVEILKDEIRKKLKQSRYQDEMKLMQYLSRQGYSYQDIKTALAEFKEVT